MRSKSGDDGLESGTRMGEMKSKNPDRAAHETLLADVSSSTC